MGPSHVTYMALKAKGIDATLLQMPLTFTAQDEGYRKLADAGAVYRSVQGHPHDRTISSNEGSGMPAFQVGSRSSSLFPLGSKK